MTDNQLAELLSLFHEIEKLMVINGAGKTKSDGTPTSFNDKVKSFDKFEPEPPKPADIGHKFYFKYGSYHIKDQYDYESDIYEELEVYKKFKLHKQRHWEYKDQVLRGNYKTLIKIGHERNQLLHIYEYKIENYRKFIKVCRSMIKYLEDPEKIPLFAYKNLNSEKDKNIKQESIFSIIMDKLKNISSSISNKFIYISSKVIYTLVIIIGLLLLAGLIKSLIVAWGIFTPLIFLILIVVGLFVTASNPIPLLLVAVYGLVLLYADYNVSFSSSKEKRVVKAPVKTNTVTDYKAAEKSKYMLDGKTEKKEPCNYYYVQTNNLNVRSESNSRSSVVDKVNINEKLCITKKEAPWYYILDTGWVHNKYLADKKVADTLVKKRLDKKGVSVWHCKASSERASGWVERVGKQNAMNGALHQCEIRRVSKVKCSVDNCYQVR